MTVVKGTGAYQEQANSLKQEYATASNNKQSNNALSNNLSGGLNASMLLYNGERVPSAKKRLEVIESQTRQHLSSRPLIMFNNRMLKSYDTYPPHATSQPLRTPTEPA